MTDEINKKVINLFSKYKKSEPFNDEEKVRLFAGFNYVKIEKDSNGKPFNPEKLLQYAEKCHYLIKVMRIIEGKTFLYNYEVSNDQLFKFIKSFENNTFNGKIIEIDKYFPEGLA